MTPPPPAFDPIKYKQTTADEWQAAAQAWNDWTPTLRTWLGPATDLMLDMAGIEKGNRVLDVAAGAGDQTLMVAERVGPTGYVLATDISAKILAFAAVNAVRADCLNVETQVADGEELDVPLETFDAVISRLGLIYFPNHEKALVGMRRALKPGGRVAAIVYSKAEKNRFFSLPISIIRRRANLPPPAAGQPGPFSLGSPGAIKRAYLEAGFRDIQVVAVSAPLRLKSAAECVRFEKESFGALREMLSGLDPAGREAAWAEIEDQMRVFERPEGFVGPCELIVAAGAK